MATPQIIARAEWGALPPRGICTAWIGLNPIGNTGHWEGAGGHADHSLCAAEVRSIQLFHFSRGYFDIAYNWLVCIHGVIFQGRDVARFESAAQRAGNPLRIAICGMWGPQWPFTPAAEAAFTWLIANAPAHARGHIIGHCDEPSCSTSCPGDIEPAIRSGMLEHGTLPPSVHPSPAPAPRPLPSAGHPHPTLAINSVGPAVMELQLKLDLVTGSKLTPDGVFGPLTQQTVRGFQAFFKLAADGVAGAKTWGMLDYCAALKH